MRGVCCISTSARRASSRRPASPSADDADAVVGTGVDSGRLDGQEPIEVARHQQRLVDARGDVRIQAARLGVRGDGFFVKPQ